MSITKIHFWMSGEWVVIPPQYSYPIIMNWVKGYALVKRNGKVIHYCTPHTPFRVPRKVPVETTG